MVRQVGRRKQLELVLACIIAMCCCFIIGWFPRALTVSVGGEERPSVLFYLIAPVSFFSAVVAVNTELSLLGFRKNSFLAVAFSLLFGVSLVGVSAGALFSSFVCSVAVQGGIRSVAVTMVQVGAGGFFLVSIFGLMILEALRRRGATKNRAEGEIETKTEDKRIEKQGGSLADD